MREAKGKKYDQWVIGETYETARRTVTETDIISFAGISGDFNPLHTDLEFAKTTPCAILVLYGVVLANSSSY